MQEDFYLDAYLISILFHENDEEKVQDVELDISIRQGFLFDLTLRKFLEEKGIPAETVAKVLADPETAPDDVKQLLDTDEFAARVRAKINALMKAYYDHLMPKLSEEERQAVEKYLSENKQLLLAQKDAMSKGLQAMINIMEAAGVSSYAELEKKDGFSQLAANYIASLETPPSTPPQSGSKYSAMVDEYLKSLGT